MLRGFAKFLRKCWRLYSLLNRPHGKTAYLKKPLLLVDNAVMARPNFLIIGSAKCGTTSLASILAGHPDCCFAHPKEASFFQDTVNCQVNQNYAKGLDCYEQFFKHYQGEKSVGEGTPSYSDRTPSPGTAARIYKFDPGMKIIYMLRDPLERQVSAWRMFYLLASGETRPSIREHAWALRGFDYWMREQESVFQWDECRYQYQLEAYLNYFPLNQVHLSILEDWNTNKECEVESALRFLNLDPHALPKDVHETPNRNSDRIVIRPSVAKLRKHAMARQIASTVPKALRRWAHEKITKVSVALPEATLSDDVRSRFISYVKSDCSSILKLLNRDVSIWKNLT